jgi:hypothetical protein
MRLVAALACLMFAAAAASAADAARKIDFTAPILDQDDMPMRECTEPATLAATDPGCKAARTVTLGALAMRALVAPEPGIAPEESLKRGQLALDVYRSAGAELTAEDIALIKRLINKVYPLPLVVVRTFPLLDPAAVK